MAYKENREGHERASIHPPLKLFSTDVSRICYHSGVFLFNSRRICQVEMVGYVFRRTACGFYMRDFAGVTFIWSRRPFLNGTYKVVCSLVHDRTVQCRYASHRRASFYEEVFFWREAVDYKIRILAETPHACNKAESLSLVQNKY
eukprot:jgi/Antlo1/1917/2469